MTRRPLRWLALIVFFSINCSPIKRQTRTTIEGDARIARAHDSQHGCEGDIERWQHAHVGGSAAIRHEHADGLVAGARVRTQAGEVTESATPIAPAHRTYLLHAGGLYLGYDGRHMGLEAGGSVIFSDDILVVGTPYLRFKSGDLDSLWFELILGSEDPLHVARLGSVGFGAHSGGFEAQVGLGLYGQFVPSSDPDRERALNHGTYDEHADTGLVVDLRYRLGGGLGLVGGGVLGRAPAGRLGLSWTLDGD